MKLFSRQTLSGFLCLFGLSLPVAAAAADMRPKCDIRILNLDEAQREKLQNRRQQYKDELRQIGRESDRNVRESWKGLFGKTSFDRQQAHKIAQEHYADDVRRTVAELSFYHDLFQMLNSRQQTVWTEKCTGGIASARF